VSGIVHTGGESLQEVLRDMWTCGITLASAYVLCCAVCHVIATLDDREKLKRGVSTDLVYYH